ncbi:hypothetical protein J6590_058053 [Homalodisca vitripennis]|nr:hypothetical protein J6590_058053 [Homalodisca vitripennis]
MHRLSRHTLELRLTQVSGRDGKPELFQLGEVRFPVTKLSKPSPTRSTLRPSRKMYEVS